jgi:hypothetical protein
MIASQLNRIHWIYEHCDHLVIRPETETNKKKTEIWSILEENFNRQDYLI